MRSRSENQKVSRSQSDWNGSPSFLWQLIILRATWLQRTTLAVMPGPSDACSPLKGLAGQYGWLYAETLPTSAQAEKEK